jgi:hypothetical protein
VNLEGSQASLFERPAARVLSLGGGVDSFALLVECIRRCSHLDAVVFVDVGDPDRLDPGEWPGTYRHIREVVIPLCRRHRIRFEIIDSTRYPVRDARSLYAWLWKRRQIPTTGPSRVCTTVAKVERFERWLDDTFPGQLVEVLIGFEAGEESRAKRDPNAGRQRKPRPGRARRVNRFPLIEWRLCRCRCIAAIERAGLEVPSASACTFCPFASKGEWQLVAAELPATFAQAAELEARKPLTGPGKKLSIMGFHTLAPLKSGARRTALHVLRDHEGVEYAAPTLTDFIRGTYTPTVEPCEVCGAPEKARKVAGCREALAA